MQRAPPQEGPGSRAAVLLLMQNTWLGSQLQLSRILEVLQEVATIWEARVTAMQDHLQKLSTAQVGLGIGCCADAACAHFTQAVLELVPFEGVCQASEPTCALFREVCCQDLQPQPTDV